jgi:hypothetical protein
MLNGRVIKLTNWKDAQKRRRNIIGIIPVFCLKGLKNPLGQFVTCF